ncbi:MAG: ABC transporter substrate-binding protein, partial [Mycobacterium leprae]
GYTQKNGEGYLTKDGKVLAFTLKYPSGNKAREASAPLIQANLKKVGIKIDLQMVEFATLSKMVFDERDMDLWLMGWSLTTDHDPGPIFSQDNKWGKVTGWKNADQQALVDKGVTVLKVSDRKPIYVQWAKIVNDELPYAFLYSQNVIEAVRADKWKGYPTDIRGALANPHEWWIPKNMQGK